MAIGAASKRRRIDSENLDRLSSLPIELIHLILKCVPFKDAVRTSALSRLWRNRWMTLPYLVFDARSGWQLTKPVDVINNVLLLHSGTIHRFEVRNFLNGCSPDVDRWMHLFARKKVNELVLDFPGGTRYKVTSSLFSCQSLRVLHLNRSIWTILPHARGFDNLVELKLAKVILTNEVISTVISKSPLRSLSLIKCYGFHCLIMYSPSLRTFKIQGPCASINFCYTPKLKDVSMELLSGDVGGVLPMQNRNHFLEDVLGGLINAKRLTVSKHFIKILGACTVTKRSCIFFQRLNYLKLAICLKAPEEMSAALHLLKRADCLQSILIESHSSGEIVNPDEGDSYEAHSLQALQLHLNELNFPKLETFILTGFTGARHELRLAQFILFNAVVLKIMKVEWQVHVQDPLRAQILENMMQFERASPRAKVIFSRHA